MGHVPEPTRIDLIAVFVEFPVRKRATFRRYFYVCVKLRGVGVWIPQALDREECRGKDPGDSARRADAH